ncbi:MAG: hypothetical protein ABGX27_03575 [Desulfurobacteriaceae bacterium]
MGRNKKQSLIDKLETIRSLIHNGNFEKARKEIKALNDSSFIKRLSREEGKLLYSYIEDLSKILRSKEQELKNAIKNTRKVKNAYLR